MVAAWSWVAVGCATPVVEPKPMPEPPDTGTVARKCDAKRLFSDLEPACSRVEVKQSIATGMASTLEREAASDLDLCAGWNAGAAPTQSIAFDFGAPEPITDLILVPEMTPDGKARHVVEGSADGETFSEIVVMEAHLQSGVPVTVELPGAPHRFIRIRTTASPSVVAWREVIPLRCR